MVRFVKHKSSLYLCLDDFVLGMALVVLTLSVNLFANFHNLASTFLIWPEKGTGSRIPGSHFFVTMLSTFFNIFI